MSFTSAVQKVEIATARNKIDRLLLALPEEEATALRNGLLCNRELSLDKTSKIIRGEAQNFKDIPADYFDVSTSAVKRWRDNTLTAVNGL